MEQKILNIISKIKQDFAINERFVKAVSGTNSQVFLSKNYVIKINKDVIAIKNEYNVIKSIKLNYLPTALCFLKLDGYGAILENKIKGDDVQKIWRRLNLKNRKKIINDLFGAISSFHQHQYAYFWSVKSNKKFKNYNQLLLYKLNKNKKRIINNITANNLFLKVADNLSMKKIVKVFKNVKPVLVHGDLIMHNILTDGKNLTSVIDWELAQFGDPFYDLARIIYYQECARDYVNEKRDVNFEYDFTTKLINALQKSIKFNKEKYKIIRSIFFVDSIIWALNSSAPEKNLIKLNPPTTKQLLGNNRSRF